MPIRSRNEPETVGPISPVAWCRLEPSFETSPLRPRMPIANPAASRNTTDEWPREKKKPTLSGRWPSVISLRVVLSMAPMWSASKAWRIPSVYAVMPTPIPNAPVPSFRCCGATNPSSSPKPITCSATIATARNAARRHSAGVSELRMRCLRVPGANVDAIEERRA